MRSAGSVVLLLLLVAGCSAPSTAPEPIASTTAPTATASATTASATTASATTASATTAAPTVTPTPTPTAPSATPTPTPTRTASAEPTDRADPRWRFYTDDTSTYRSAWFDGAHRILIGYGCTRAPYYDPDPRCPGRQGSHHGIDVAMPCGTTLRAGVAGTVIDPNRPGRPGAAYGSTAFRIRVDTASGRADVLIGHAQTVDVRPGDRVHAGQRIALAGDRGAPDGCHLHFELRRPDGGVSTASDPSRLLGLRRAG